MCRYLLGLWFVAGAASAQQIQYAEPVDLTTTATTAQFEAYGRQFRLELSGNERALQKLPSQRKRDLTSYRLLRGSIEGQPGSWVRLTETPSGLEGAIWDGRELYAVTRHERIAAALTTPLAAGPQETVIYRLSDLRDALPRDFCALDAGAPAQRKQSALDQYQDLVTSLSALTPGTLETQIEIALVADSAFVAAESPDPVAAMLARFNIVEGIYSEQLGLLVLASDVRVLPADEDPFTSTQAATLLEQFAGYRAANPALRGRALGHLMTGRKLDGTTAGIAYMTSACSVEHGASLSTRGFGTAISALIMAHELGHNLGAPHDGEAGACASVGGGYIMAPSVSGFTTFSNCSLNAMRATLAQASCVAPASYADVSLAPTLDRLSGEGGVPFTLPFTLRSSGTLAAADARFELELPAVAGLTLQALSAESASCSIDGMRGTCEFGSVEPGETRAISALATGTQAGSITLLARVGAANDPLTSNNSRAVEVTLRSGVDAAVSVSTDAAEVPLGAPLQVFAEVRSLRALPVRDAVLSLTLNQPVLSASMPGASCAPGSHGVICNIAEIPSGGVALLTVLTQTTAAGPLYAAANVSAAGDGEFSNNSANGDAWVQAARDLELAAGPARVELAVGGWHEIPFLVRSRGAQAAGESALEFSVTSDVVAVEVVDAGGANCAPVADGAWRCAVGALAPGVTQLVRVRVQGQRAGLANVTALVAAADDGYTGNNAASLLFEVDNTVDLGLLFGAGGAGLEGEDVAGQVLLRSSGREAVTGASLDVELHAAGALRGVSIHGGADCELLTPQLARCALPTLPRNTSLSIDYRARFEDPGTYDVNFRLNTPGDTQPDNDVLTRPVVVRPYYDVAVVGASSLDGFLVGEVREVTYEVRTGPRALSSARFLARHGGDTAGVRVRAIRSSLGDCRIESEGGVCDFTDLAAQSALAVQVTLEALSACRQDLDVEVITSGDVVSTNNVVTASISVLGATDLDLRVAETASGPAGTSLAFPAISIVNGGAIAVGARLEVSLPEGVTLVTVSASAAICSGNRVLRCDFADIDANGTATVNLSVRGARGGSYLSALKVSAFNDTNPANDARQVTLEISEAAAAPTPAAGKSGGGGRLEWLLLFALAGVVMGKMGQENGDIPIFRARTSPVAGAAKRKIGMSPFSIFRGRPPSEHVRVRHERHVRPVR